MYSLFSNLLVGWPTSDLQRGVFFAEYYYSVIVGSVIHIYFLRIVKIVSVVKLCQKDVLLSNFQELHSQKQSAHSAVDVAAQMVPCFNCIIAVQGSWECGVFIYLTVMKKFTNLFQMKINS